MEVQDIIGISLIGLIIIYIYLWPARIAFKKNNPLKSKGNINIWINSKSYNFVENITQIWLLSIVDLIIGKHEYKAK